MHTAIHLAPVLAAEKSKTAFYIAGGALVLWALVISLGVGLRRAEFPYNMGGERTVAAISVVLVVAAVVTAVATSGSPAKAGERSSTSGQTQPTPSIASSPTPAPPGNPASTATTPSGGAVPSAATAPSTTKAPSGGGASTKLSLAADAGGALNFDTKALSAKAGRITLTFSNPSPLEHNVTLAQGSKVLGATPTFVGGSHTVTLTLSAGTYTFYCSVPGHRAAGMEGTLKVS